MLKSFICFFLLLFATYSFGQNKVRDYVFQEVNGIRVKNNYKKLKVVDQRTNKDDLGIIQVGAFNSLAKVIPSIPIDKQLENLFIDINLNPTGEDELVLVLQKFLLAEGMGGFSEYGYFDFRAVLFKKDRDTYLELTKIDTTSVVKGVDVTKKSMKVSSKIVEEFFKKSLIDTSFGQRTISYEDLLNYDSFSKNLIPLYRNEILVNGVYNSYNELKNQQPSSEVFLKKDDVSNGFYVKDDKGKLKKVSHKEEYAVIYNNSLFVAGLNDFYESFKDDGDFYFVGQVKLKASNATVTGAAIAFGALGAILATTSSSTEYRTLKIDYVNGDFMLREDSNL